MRRERPKVGSCSELPCGSVLLPHELMGGAMSPEQRAGFKVKKRLRFPHSFPELLGSPKVGKAPLCSVSLLYNQLLTYRFHFHHAYILFKTK